MKVRSKQYSGRSANSANASSFPLNRDQVEDFRPAQTFEVKVLNSDSAKGDERPRGAILS